MEEFGILIGVSHAAVSRYCHGKRRPRIGILHRIMDITGGKVRANDFWGAPK